MFKLILRLTATVPLLLLPMLVQADGGDVATSRCAQCHAIQKPASASIDERLQRKAPPLYYAGNKYRKEWLVQWLQSPQTIHPAGYFPHTAVKSTPDGDVAAPEKLHKHLSLDSANAVAVADYLMSLRPHDDLLAKDNYSPGSVSKRLGQMDFRKFKGCNACHQDAPGEGGLSGPVLHNAWQRLQPGFISSFVQNPTAWDPNSMMPVPQMNEGAVHKLVNYLRAIGGEQ